MNVEQKDPGHEAYFDLKLIEHHLKNYHKMSSQKAENFKALMFGWKVNENEEYEPTLFEKILSTPKTDSLTNLIWNVFKLWQKGFILNLVRFAVNSRFVFDVSFVISRVSYCSDIINGFSMVESTTR